MKQFRAKNEQGEWEQGHVVVFIEGNQCLIDMSDIDFTSVTDDGVGYSYLIDQQAPNPVQEDTICKNTGEVDINGIPIFQKDIVREHYADGSEGGLHLVDCAYSCGDRNDCFIAGFRIGNFASSTYVIIGNEFDNPELMEIIEQCD